MINRFKAMVRFKDWRLQKILDWLIEADYLAIVFFIPLWFSYWYPTYYIFELNKISLFQVLLFSLLFFIVLRLIYFPVSLPIPTKKFFKKYLVYPLIFICGLSLTLVFSIDPLLSFYGIMEREMGLSSYWLFFLWFFLVTFGILIISQPQSPEFRINIRHKIKRLMITAVISGALVSLYGILQIMNIDFLTWPEPPFLTGRTFSTFGQPNFLASWLLLVIPLSFYLFFSSRCFLSKFFLFIAFLSNLTCLFFTGSRGGVIALLFSGAVTLVWLLFSSQWPKKKKYLATLLFVFFGLAFLSGLDYFSHGRVRDLARANIGSFGARVNLYESAISAIGDKPFEGYGLETGREVFIKYYNADWGVYGNVGQSADRAHNLILDILLTTGFLGLLLFGLLYWHLFRLLKAGVKNSQNRSRSLALGFGLVAYLFSLLFSFTIVGGEVFFWLYLAILTLINFSQEFDDDREKISVANREQPQLTGAKRITVHIIATVILVTIVYFPIAKSVQTLVADHYFNQAFISISVGDYVSLLRFCEDLERQVTNPVNRADYANYLGDKLSDIYAALKDPKMKSAYRIELQKIDQDIPENGYRNLFAKAKINKVLGDYSRASNYVSRIIEITPHWPFVYLEEGNLFAVQGNSKPALVAYYLALLNTPSADDFRLNSEHLKDVLNYRAYIYQCIADIYLKDKDYVAAEKYYQLAYRSKPADYTLLKKIADTYYFRGDLATAINYNRHGFERNPQDYNWPLALAILYYESGNKTEALKYLNSALKLAPDNKEALRLRTEYGK